MRLRVREIIRHVCDERGVTIIHGGLLRDHVHLFVEVPPHISTGDDVSLNYLARFEAHSQPGCDVCCEGHAWQEVGGKLVVAGGDALEVLQAAEGVLDEVAVAIARFIVADDALAILATGNEWFGTCLS